jgi:uncharacterized membrane protein
MSMRQLILAGILILGLGAFLLLSGGSITTRRQVLKVGEVKVTADEQQSIPPWVGGVAMVAGVALIIAGAQKRASSRA